MSLRNILIGLAVGICLLTCALTAIHYSGWGEKFLFLILLGVVVPLGWLQSRSEKPRVLQQKQHALNHIQGRPAISNNEFGSRFFDASQADVAAEVREIFARHIEIDISQAYPDDKVVEDLRMDELDSMSTVEFVVELEDHFKIKISDSAASEMRTLRDIVEYVSHELRKNL